MLKKPLSFLGSMRVTLSLRSSVDENAARYFEAAKKARKKAKGAKKTITEWRARAARKENTPQEQKRERQKARKKEWFEKFRWCYSSDGFLLLGGRDATTNELLIKKHAEPKDIVFHTDMAGSPFVIIKSDGKNVLKSTMEEAAQFCVSFSRAWRNGMSSLEAFHVAPEQVTKEANPGEFLGKGAFMIRGKTTYHKPLLKVAIGIDAKGRVMAGPPRAVRKHCERYAEVLQGREKTSDVAKELRRLFGGGNLDELIAALPPGGVQIMKK